MDNEMNHNAMGHNVMGNAMGHNVMGNAMGHNVMGNAMGYTEIKMENSGDFNVLIINKGKIEGVEWNDPNYIAKIFKMNRCNTFTMNKDNFLLNVGRILDTDKYYDTNTIVTNEIIGEEPYYVYELLYVDLIKHPKYHEEINDMATLVNTNSEKIYTNAIVLKTYLPPLSESMHFESVSCEDLMRVLYHRAYTKVVLYRNYEYVEDNVLNLDDFADKFFEGEYYKKVELAFLSHNINIWYVPSIESKENGICGKLVDEPVERCIWFTMNTATIRGNITQLEVEKIIFLSNKLTDYNPHIDLMEQKLDKHGRLIIKNKYRILDEKYNEYKNKK